MMKRLFPITLFLLCYFLGNAQIELVKDINPNGSSMSDIPRFNHSIVLNDLLFFTANDSVHGEELWVSDGLEENTLLLKDIWKGTSGSSIIRFTAHSGEVYFYAEDSVSGAELWKSDGTPEGTVMVADANPGPDGSANLVFDDIISLGDILIYEGYDPINGQELRWVDQSGDRGVLQDLSPGRRSSSFSSFYEYNGKMYCAGPSSDFTKTGFYEVDRTGVIRKIGDIDGNIERAIQLDDGLLMQLAVGFSKQLHIYKPTQDEVTPVLELAKNQRISRWLPYKDGIIYTVTGGEKENAIYTWAGGDTTTIYTFESFLGRAPIQLTEFKGEYYCYAFDDQADGLYKIDAENKSANLIFEFQGSTASGERLIFKNEEFMLISAEESSFNSVDRGYEVYISDGSRAGSRLLQDLNPGTDHSDPVSYREIYPGLIVFAANDGQTGHELFKYTYNPSSIFSNDNADPQWISVQPNASEDCYQIIYNVSDLNLSYRVFNSVGVSVMSGKLSTSICLENQRDGQYFIEISDQKQRQVIPVLKF